MSMIKALRTLAAIENGTLNATTLETQVAGSQARKDEISQLLSVKSMHDRIASSRMAMDALAGSATAWGEAMKHRYITNFIAACVESVNAKMAFYNSDVALNALKASPAAMAALRVASRYSVINAAPNSATPVTVNPPGNANILLGASLFAGTAATHIFSTLRGGSGVSAVVTNNGILDQLAQDTDVAIPLTGPYSFTSSIGGFGSVAYFGFLRCDA